MELELRTVLVPSDFSEASDRAIGVAFRLARDHGGEVVLVHAIHLPPPPSPLYAHYYPVPAPEQLRKTVEESTAALRARVPAVYRDSVPFRCIVRMGDAAHEILEIAAEVKASVVVISTHGRSGLSRFAFGSVAERVVRHAQCPVFVVR